MNDSLSKNCRWYNYVCHGGDGFRSFWSDQLRDNNRRLLVVLGLGFDPRMCLGLTQLLEVIGTNQLDCLLIEHIGPMQAQNHSLRAAVDQNLLTLRSLAAKRGKLIEEKIPIFHTNGDRIGPRRAAAILDNLDGLASYSDILLDISSLPRSIYFSLLNKLLLLAKSIEHLPQGPAAPNVHVVASENPSLDSRIVGDQLDERAEYLFGFSAGLLAEAKAHIPKVWFPILGEGKTAHLEKIDELVRPDEVCPILPSPARNPRRGDDLVYEYRELLFDRMRVDPSNFIYASESNPFDVYRQIMTASNSYSNSLGPLNGCRIVISALSSKLLSVGALLAAYNLKHLDYTVGIAHVEPLTYSQVEGPGSESASKVYTICLSGVSYEQ